MSIVSWDVETTIKQRFKRKASPFGAGNWVVTHAFKSPDKPVVEHRFGSQPPGPGWLRPVLTDCKLLCGFNIKFDLLHALQDPDNLEAWMDFIVAGGNIWDCQLAEYMLEGMDQRNHMLSLDEVAPRYGGNIKFDEVKALWQAGVDTHEIEPAMLTRYLCGTADEAGDIGNTEKIARAQLQRARDCGQLRSLLLNMGSLVCSTEMERNGMYADKARGIEIAAELKIKLDELAVALQAFLPKNLPFQFNWGSPTQKSALLFGGTVKYDSREYVHEDGSTTLCDVWTIHGKPLVYAQKDEVHYILEDGSTMECAWWEHCVATEWCGQPPEDKCRTYFKAGKQAGDPKTRKVKVNDPSKPKARNCKAPYTFPRMTEPDPKWAGAVAGVWGTSSEVIEELGTRDLPFLKTLAQLQKIGKDLGTYYITVDEDGTEKGMLSLVDEHGIIHHKINHTSTVTGRFSSSDPNLQNIPKGNKSDVKTLFVSRFGPEGKIIQSDFSALEVYVQAILTNCRQLIEDLRAGLDMHCKRLALKTGRPYDEVLKLCKGYVNEAGEQVPADKEWDYMRTGAKVFSFQRAYGAGAAKIAASTGMAIEDVMALIEAEDLEYHEIKDHFEKRTFEIQANRKPSGVVIPHPTVPGVMCHIGKSFIRTPDGKLYGYTESPAPEFLIRKNKPTASFSPTEIKNYEVQGTGGEWMKAAMWIAVREFYRERNFKGLALLVNTVHDAAYTDSHKDVALQAAGLLHACMEEASNFMEFWFAWPIPVPVPSDTSWGSSMAEEKKIDGLLPVANEYRTGIRARYMPGFTPSYQGTKNG